MKYAGFVGYFLLTFLKCLHKIRIASRNNNNKQSIFSVKMMELMSLGDHCLIKVFTYCDIETLLSISKTCKYLKWIVETFNYPKIKKYISYSDTARSTDKSIIKCVGKYIQQLSVTFGKKSFVKSNDYCEFLVQNIGTNIRNLEIVSDGEVIPSLELLPSILNQLDVLKLSFQREAEDAYQPSKKTYSVDLAIMCPNLQKFEFSGYHRFPPNCSSFSRLESLTVYTYCQYNREIDIFLEKNPQITEVCFGSDGAKEYINFDDFTQNFVNLKKLNVSMRLIQYGSWSPHIFGRLEKLHTLRLTYVRNNFNEILSNIAQLKQLTSISVDLTSSIGGVTTTICQQTLVRIGRELENLQFFYIWQPIYKEISWDRNTVIDFVRCATNLKAVNFQHFNFECTSIFIRDLVDARKFSNPNAEPLEIGTDDNNFDSMMKVKIYIYKLFNRNLIPCFYHFESGGRCGSGTIFEI